MTKEDAFRLIRACMSSLEEAQGLLAAEPTLLDARTGLGETPLHYLAVEDHLEGVRFLHERGAPIEVRNEFGETALSESLRLGSAVANYLMDHGADVHALNPGGESMLHAAAAGGDPSLVRRVLALGVPAQSQNELLETPLHVAVWKNALEIVDVLVAAGADVNARMAFDETPLHIAAEHGLTSMVRLLLSHGADPAARHAKGTTPEGEAERNGFAEVAALLATSRKDEAG